MDRLWLLLTHVQIVRSQNWHLVFAARFFARRWRLGERVCDGAGFGPGGGG